MGTVAEDISYGGVSYRQFNFPVLTADIWTEPDNYVCYRLYGTENFSQQVFEGCGNQLLDEPVSVLSAEIYYTFNEELVYADVHLRNYLDGEYVPASEGQDVSNPPPPPRISISCGGPVDVLETVTCQLQNLPSDQSLTIEPWEFTGQALSLQGPGGLSAWSGPAVASGQVSVNVHNDTLNETHYGTVTVNRRPGWSWTNRITSGRAQGTELDVCMDSWLAGLVSGKTCTATDKNRLFTPVRGSVESGYSAWQVPGTGPNGGLYFVTIVSFRMDLLAQIQRDLRPDGDPHPLVGPEPFVANFCMDRYGNTNARRTFEVNVECDPAVGYSTYLDALWVHEERHLALGLPSGQSAANDLEALVEPLVANTPELLRTFVLDVYDQAHTRVYNDAMRSHLDPNVQQFQFWRFVNGAWTWYTDDVVLP